MAGPSDLAGFMDAPETGLYKATEISFNMEGDAGLNCSSRAVQSPQARSGKERKKARFLYWVFPRMVKDI